MSHIGSLLNLACACKGWATPRVANWFHGGTSTSFNYYEKMNIFLLGLVSSCQMEFWSAFNSSYFASMPCIKPMHVYMLIKIQLSFYSLSHLYFLLKFIWDKWILYFNTRSTSGSEIKLRITKSLVHDVFIFSFLF